MLKNIEDRQEKLLKDLEKVTQVEAAEIREASAMYDQIVEANRRLMEQDGILPKMLQIDNYIDDLQAGLAELQ